MAEMHEQLRAFIVANFMFGRGGEAVSNHVSLVESGIMDSTGVLELVAFVEQTYGIHVDEREIVPANFDTVHGLAGFVERKRSDTTGLTVENASSRASNRQ